MHREHDREPDGGTSSCVARQAKRDQTEGAALVDASAPPFPLSYPCHASPAERTDLKMSAAWPHEAPHATPISFPLSCRPRSHPRMAASALVGTSSGGMNSKPVG